jgi:signal peptidase I
MNTFKNPVLKEIFDWTVHIIIAVLIGLIIVNFVIQRTVVDGVSMEPTLQNGDNLWVEKISPRLGGLHRGDIVTINVPDKVGTEKNPLIKRIIAVENDTIEIKDGKVFINGKLQTEHYILGNYTGDPVDSQNNNVKIKKGYVYVLGDNRQNSTDSRIIGPVEVRRIIGKAVIRIYPFSKLGFVGR